MNEYIISNLRQLSLICIVKNRAHHKRQLTLLCKEWSSLNQWSHETLSSAPRMSTPNSPLHRKVLLLEKKMPMSIWQIEMQEIGMR